MTKILYKTLAWKVIILRCGLYVFVSMASVFVAASSGWTAESVANMAWWSWLGLILNMLIAGANQITGFIDKSAKEHGEKLKLSEAYADMEAAPK